MKKLLVLSICSLNGEIRNACVIFIRKFSGFVSTLKTKLQIRR
jgi:hypothetical protein